MNTKLVDQRTLDLARVFVDDCDGALVTENRTLDEHVQRLAGAIQGAVEDYINDWEVS